MLRSMSRSILAASLVMVLVPTTIAAAAGRQLIPFQADIQGCGDDVTLSGTLVAIENQRPLPGGGSLITFSNHFLPNSVVVTSSSGAAYRFVSVEHTTVAAMPSGGFTFSALQRLKLIGQGDAPTLHVRFTLHVTVLPNGELAVAHETSSTQCR